MAHTYYIDAINGSDSNSGTSASSALQSLEAASALKLKPGDTVLLARGATYQGQLAINDSGSASHPITVGAYGDGASPIITGADTGINGSHSHYVVVQDLTVANTTGQAIFARNAVHWTIDNVTVLNSGSESRAGGISFENGNDVTIKNSTLSGVHGDGIVINNSNDITLANNRVDSVHGHDADSIQVTNSSGISITGNHLDMTGSTDSTKGNVLVNMSDHVTVEDNVLVGGAYGASVNSNNVTIAGNEVYGQKGFSWNFGVGIGEAWSVKNYDIHDNYIHDVAYGVAITGSGSTPASRTNIGVHDNTFDNITGAALKVDRPASGSFWDNHISANSPAERVSPDNLASGKFHLGSYTTYTPPQAESDVVHAASTAATVKGNVLANDHGADLSLADFAGRAVGDSMTFNGKYGSVHINDDGSFIYTVNDAALKNMASPASDVFHYLVSDGFNESSATLSVDLDPRVRMTAINDGKSVDADGSASGNLLANDLHRDGDMLHLRTVGSTKIGNSPVDITGHYGVLSIAADGTFTYQADAAKVAGHTGILHDSFMYKISDGSLQDSASLSVAVDTHVFDAQAHTDFHM